MSDMTVGEFIDKVGFGPAWLDRHACDLCGETVHHELPQDRRIAVCVGCGFLYVPERRTAAEIAKSWEAIYKDGLYDPNWPAVKARLYYVAEWLDQTIGLKGKSLLDIGAGRGQFMRQAAKRGAKVFGIEPAAMEYDYDIVKRSIEDGPLYEKFDVVTINWTLENCGDCVAMLRFAREHCKSDGWVSVATGSRILVPFKKPIRKYLNPEIPADLHCFRWSVGSLGRALETSGISFHRTNPFEECDWLVMRGQPSSEEPVVGPGDDPAEVLAFFATWQKITDPAPETTWSRR